MSEHKTNSGAGVPGNAPAKCITLGLIQMRCNREPKRNLAHAIELIKRAADSGAKLVALSELFCTPYFCREDTPEAIAAAEEFAVTIPGSTTDALSDAARANKVVLVGGSVYEKAGDQYFNTAPVFNSDGELLGAYRKTHIPHDQGFWEQHYFDHGDTGIAVFDTEVGKVAVQICYDQWFPEGARLAALKGAEFLVYPTAIGDVDFAKFPQQGEWRQMWTTAQAGHAICNHLFVAAVNRVGQEGETNFWGGSFVADPCGRVTQGGVAEEIVLVHCDRSLLEIMRLWRFFQERRPHTYGGLIEAVEEPVQVP